MKVIGQDNWDRDYNGGRSEKVAGENLPKDAAEDLAEKLNKIQGKNGDTYYVVRGDDYAPYKFEGY